MSTGMREELENFGRYLGQTLRLMVGVPDYDAYSVWDGGRCVNIDAPAEKRRIREALEAEYGSVYFSG